MSQSDDGADDPQLKSLRAVWLSMPDEDPPSRGLDALMAAARAQAEVFASPPWWKRALHALARPPVLALATIMILIGGAVLISKRDAIKDAGPAASSPAPATAITPAPPPAPPPAGPTDGKADGKDRREVDKLDEKKPAVVTPVLPATRPPAIDHSERRVEDPKPAAPPPPSPVHRAPARPRTTPVPPASGRLGGDEAPAFEQGTTSTGTTTAKPDSSKTEDTVDAKTGEAAPPNQTRAPTPRQALVDQLIVQCRAAATRGDCEEAKLIARRIAAQSTAYYKEHVANDATIQKCIAPPAVNAAPVSQ